MYKGIIPFNRENGRAIGYWPIATIPLGPCVDGNVEWKENEIFRDNLRLVSYSRGRSSVTFNWISTNTGVIYETSLSQGFALIPHLKDMCYEGQFVFAKRGCNYLLEVLDNDI